MNLYNLSFANFCHANKNMTETVINNNKLRNKLNEIESPARPQSCLLEM